MQAIKEIGFKKAFKFTLFSFFQLFFSLMILPQFRKLLLKIGGAKIGSNSMIMNIHFFNWHHRGLGGLNIGRQCFIGDETLIDLYDEVVLEDSVTIAQRVTLLTHINVGYKNHPLQKYFPSTSSPILLKKGSVIGACSTILPGIVIGENSMVAAGAVVIKDVSPMTLVGGVPAKEIRKLDEK